MLKEADVLVACPICRSKRLEPSSDTSSIDTFYADDRNWQCLDCRDRDRLATMNILWAKERFSRPESCDGCIHHGVGLNPGYPRGGPGQDGPYKKLSPEQARIRNLCQLYRFDLGPAAETHKPLTRFCFTWEG